MDQSQDENPYRSPQAALAEPVAVPAGQLADRIVRLAASILDTIILMVVFMPIAYFGGYFQQVMDNAASGRQFMPIGVTVLWSCIGFAVFVLLQGYPLHTRGQTWGKRICKIRIVDLDGNKPSLGHLLLRRYLPVNVVAAIPLVGMLGTLVDTLLIFREDRRCGHDLIAGTRVVVARSESA
ncbi:RDD family protein [Lysobacter silvisoli]|uniref:RDD family protein n=1 Tax=Lysobacter silvisoli TaxID=2293254 RepID=A0A371K4S5_9GAMM|nr:RDD family protein [Lysobacter silvisoli]RDZ28847.1 RDD family protein [Lysobacter silvisoli]